MSKHFSGKVAIVTGSSNGIGRATAILFAEEGAKVTIHGRDEKALQEAKAEVEAAGGCPDCVISVKGDIRDAAVQKELIDATIAKFGHIDILVNNAGGSPENCPRKGFQQNDDDFDYTIDLNTKSVVSLSKLVLPHLSTTKGEIVNVSSIAALNRAARMFPYYSMSKAALDSFTRSFAIEAIGKGVRVNSVNPGIVKTTIMQKQGLSDEMVDHVTQMMLDDKRNIPAGVAGTPRDIAELIGFLSDRKRSSYIIGQTIVIDGGSSIMMNLNNAFETMKPPSK